MTRSEDSPVKLSRWSWVLLAASCRPAATGPVSPGGQPCQIPPDAIARLDTVTVAFSEQENESGRMVLRLTGEMLVRVDRQGRIRPSLANH